MEKEKQLCIDRAEGNCSRDYITRLPTSFFQSSPSPSSFPLPRPLKTISSTSLTSSNSSMSVSPLIASRFHFLIKIFRSLRQAMENIPQSHTNQSFSLKEIQEFGYTEPRISFYKLDVFAKATADALGITAVLVLGCSVYRARQGVSLFVTTFWPCKFV